ncbi:hypothetical protein SRABI84_03946 [Peribacillus simplex]|uniref:hypothetical protein n=1 Tax=Peribacillus simplex TaxID=1478 RepID=UPI001D37013F|nr:hypothetical protein [Peribacillus simplex]CAH0282227.1 hypothetical protein SRABI84_03946 [Peribacillus simplex]
MGNCSGHWNNWNKNDKGKFERNDHKDHKDSCKSCGHHDKSACDCNFRSIKKDVKLNSDCFVVNSVVCSKMVQKVAELTLPFSLFAGTLTSASQIVSIVVTPNLAGIVHNKTIIRDKVVNIGFVPASIVLTFIATPGGTPTVLPAVNVNLPFQEHTDCPGACPEDTLTETPLVVEGIFNQPGVSTTATVGGVTLNVLGILFKIVLRTTITVTRPVIVDKHGGICDINDRRCDPLTAAPSFTLPSTPTGP